MEQANYQESDIKLFSKYVADPSASGSGDSIALQRTLDKFPYCQLLHLFYTHSLSVSESGSLGKQLSRTALFVPDRTVLYTILQEPEKLISTGTGIFADQEAFNKKEVVKDTIETSVDLGREEEEVQSIIPDSSAANTRPKHGDGSDLLENIFNNIIGFNSEELSPDLVQERSDPGSVLADDEVKAPATENAIHAEPLPKDDVKASPIQEFVPVEEPAANQSLSTESEEVIPDTDQNVSKYNDDKMPYSFLWWLNKTRKEHSHTYQPYVDFKLDTSQIIRRSSADQLSSQIIENIFHLQSPLDQLENAPRTIPFQVKRREDFILEKFIKEEPQIKAPNSQNLDTENKARKSAEDPNDLVSETLAQIYTDQMLFQKAIDTYKKLSLKFPEKSTYFADQILELEKKVN